MRISSLALSVGSTLLGFGLGAVAISLIKENKALSAHGMTPSAQVGNGDVAGATVSVVRPRRENFQDETGLVALVSPRTVASAHFLVPGRVESCRVQPGDTVAAGEVLCRLDLGVVNLEKERARAGVNSAERALDGDFLERQKALYESGVIGQGDFERVRIESEKGMALRDDARTALALAEKKADLHTLRAPFAGKVMEVRTRKGMPVSPEVPAVVLSSAGAFVLKAEVPARHWARVRKGTELRVTSVASESVAEPGLLFRVSEKSPSVNVEKQGFEVEFIAVSPLKNVELAPGMLVSGILALAAFDAVPVLPFEALTRWESVRGEGEVFVRDPRSGRVRSVSLRTSPPVKGLVRVLSGLDEFAEVVSPVPASLREGDMTLLASPVPSAPPVPASPPTMPGDTGVKP